MKRLWNWIKRVVARYEAGYWNWTGDRTYINSTVQDARFDANASTRIEILRKARYFEQNNPIVQRLVDLFEQFTVGADGLQVIPNSSNETWNQAARQSWLTWCRYPDLVSKQYFGCIQSMMARRWFIDGEIFLHKTRGQDREGKMFPRIRLYESHRCYTPQDRSKEEGKTVIDGVEIDAIGRPKGYWFHRDEKDQNSTGFDLIPADQIVHLFEPERPGMYRGLSFLYAAMNDLHDLDDIQMYEKRAAKAASRWSIIIKNAGGQADASTLRRLSVKTNSPNSAGTTVTKPDDQWYQSTFGGDDLTYLKIGEDATQFQSNRPSVTQQAFWEHLIAKICAGVGISKLLVLPYSMQGTVTRADLDISTIFFRSRSSVIAVAVREIYEWYMKFAKDYDMDLGKAGKAPADWFKATIRPPRSPNVDTGRNSMALISEYQAGLITLEDIYAERGQDWREALNQRAQEANYVQELLKKYPGITKEDIFNPTGTKPTPNQMGKDPKDGTTDLAIQNGLYKWKSRNNLESV